MAVTATAPARRSKPPSDFELRFVVDDVFRGPVVLILVQVMDEAVWLPMSC